MGEKTCSTETRASSLMLSLSLFPKQTKITKKKKRKMAGIFECKTCNRQFPSFQALGGHRTSHLRPKVQFNGLELVIGSKIHKPVKRHVCNICGKEFMLGQALGGHMRLHRSNQPLEEDLISRVEQIEIDLNKIPV